MPTVSIKHTPPLPEGEYVGAIEKVASSFTKNGDPRFTYSIRMKDGKVIKDNLYFGENVLWRIEQLCKSADLVPPESGAPFTLTPDDLEKRIVHFAVKYNPGEGGKVYTNINYHAVSYALQQNPALAGAYPPQTPRKLREAPQKETPPPSDEGASSAPASSTPPQPPVSPAAVAEIPEAEDDSLSPEEYAEALAAAKRTRSNRSRREKHKRDRRTGGIPGNFVKSRTGCLRPACTRTRLA